MVVPVIVPVVVMPVVVVPAAPSTAAIIIATSLIAATTAIAWTRVAAGRRFRCRMGVEDDPARIRHDGSERVLARDRSEHPLDCGIPPRVRRDHRRRYLAIPIVDDPFHPPSDGRAATVIGDAYDDRLGQGRARFGALAVATNDLDRGRRSLAGEGQVVAATRESRRERQREEQRGNSVLRIHAWQGDRG
jgi:hypothetical protein